MQLRPPVVDSPLICIVGPTASGKTGLALEVAPLFDGEVVAADSRQIYRGMNIGTSKPTMCEQKRLRHHMIDVADPFDEFSVVSYLRGALEAINEIESRGRTPFLVGGTGQYVEALTRGVSPAPANPEIRRKLEDDLVRYGIDDLAARLRSLDPVGAGTIDLKNPRRVLRAIEVKLATGKSIRELEERGQPARRTLVLGLHLPRAELSERIRLRVDMMIEQGLLDEARRLWSSGHGKDSVASRTIGYSQAFDYLFGRCTLAEAREATAVATRQYARRQMTWFRNRERVEWYPRGRDTVDGVSRRIREFLAGEGA
ncbi:MAG: tRNA (adenosine(37)-N6)-dimethylallyltransferase MiaA [Chloroflexi bacterium]|nr:tRNA (adenosine(37)-N6)-dimethylallyltransferase MiaA [Chloroflexota bacterium]MCY3937003.1 tRNA (adenosine(37)-N6)-dimethylallyltransferase MiaA [Chloroflexota bacterium]